MITVVVVLALAVLLPWIIWRIFLSVLTHVAREKRREKEIRRWDRQLEATERWLAKKALEENRNHVR